MPLIVFDASSLTDLVGLVASLPSSPELGSPRSPPPRPPTAGRRVGFANLTAGGARSGSGAFAFVRAAVGAINRESEKLTRVVVPSIGGFPYAVAFWLALRRNAISASDWSRPIIRLSDEAMCGSEACVGARKPFFLSSTIKTAAAPQVRELLLELLHLLALRLLRLAHPRVQPLVLQLRVGELPPRLGQLDRGGVLAVCALLAEARRELAALLVELGPQQILTSRSRPSFGIRARRSLSRSGYCFTSSYDEPSPSGVGDGAKET